MSRWRVGLTWVLGLCRSILMALRGDFRGIFLLCAIAIGLFASYRLDTVDVSLDPLSEQLKHSASILKAEAKSAWTEARALNQNTPTKAQEALSKLRVSAKPAVKTEHQGMDISHYQGDLVEELGEHESLDFVISKATQGAYYIDPKFHSNWRSLAQKGLIRGAYHFYDAKYPPKIQAQHFIDTLGSLKKDDISPILDIEHASVGDDIDEAQLLKDVQVFLEVVSNAFSRTPIIYTSYSFGEQKLTAPWLARYPLWIAEYTKAASPRVPSVWQTQGYLIWQKSDSYHFASQKIDLDVFIGDIQDLMR